MEIPERCRNPRQPAQKRMAMLRKFSLLLRREVGGDIVIRRFDRLRLAVIVFCRELIQIRKHEFEIAVLHLAVIGCQRITFPEILRVRHPA